VLPPKKSVRAFLYISTEDVGGGAGVTGACPWAPGTAADPAPGLRRAAGVRGGRWRHLDHLMALFISSSIARILVSWLDRSVRFCSVVRVPC